MSKPKSGRPPGNQSKLTPDTVNKLCQAIALGAHYHDACNYAGIGYSTLREWMVAHETGNGDERHSELAERIKEAEGQATIGLLAKIERAANEGTWQAAAWKLERRYPERYGRTIQQVDGKLNLSHDIDAIGDRLRNLIIAAAAAHKAQDDPGSVQ